MNFDDAAISRLSQAYLKETIKSALKEASEEFLAEKAEREKWKNFWFHIRLFIVPLFGGFAGMLLGQFLSFYLIKN